MKEIEKKVKKAYTLERKADLLTGKEELEAWEEIELSKSYGGMVIGSAIAATGGILTLGPYGVALLPVGHVIGEKTGRHIGAYLSRKSSHRMIDKLGLEGIKCADELRYIAIDELLDREVKESCCTRYGARALFDQVHAYSMKGSWKIPYKQGWRRWSETYDARIALQIPKPIWAHLETDPKKVIEAYALLDSKLHGYCRHTGSTTTISSYGISEKVIDAGELIMAEFPSKETITELESVVKSIPQKEMDYCDKARHERLMTKF
jgi:hypothetical protein